MKKSNLSLFFQLLGMLFFIAGCDQNASTSSTKSADTTVPAEAIVSTAMPPYDPAMDAFLTGGDAIQKLKDTLGIKFYVVTLKPGDSAMLHSHPDHAVYVLEGGKLRVSFKGNPDAIVMDMKAGESIVGGPVSDAARNIGNTTIKLVIADIYRPRDK
jgi:quercetin dioxygenase-like cupin family protein